MKKGRHRRFEEARALKRSSDIDFDKLLESLHKDTSSTARADDEDDDLIEDDEDEDDDELR